MQEAYIWRGKNQKDSNLIKWLRNSACLKAWSRLRKCFTNSFCSSSCVKGSRKSSFRSLLVSLFIKVRVLLDRIVRAIYVPNDVYCIHIDKNFSEVFRKAIQAIIRCLPNVFIAANSVDVHWRYVTVVEAQFSCMEELLKSQVKWEDYISLVGQDFPLYDYKQVVKALRVLTIPTT